MQINKSPWQPLETIPTEQDAKIIAKDSHGDVAVIWRDYCGTDPADAEPYDHWYDQEYVRFYPVAWMPIPK
jgi:hypothetical protein